MIDIHTDDRGKVVEEVERASEKDNRIRRRAYDLWEREGSPQAGQEKHWAQARQEIESEDAAGRGSSG